MRIAFIGQKGIPMKYGGIETHVQNLATRLAHDGHEVFVYVRDYYTDPNLTEYKGVKLIHVPTIKTKHLDAITHTFFSTVHALFQDFDIIHYHAIGPTALSIIPKFLLRKTRVVATFHCQDYFHQKWNYLARQCLKFGEYVACHIPDSTIVVSKVLRDYALRAYGKQTIYIPNGAAIQVTKRVDEVAKWGMSRKRYIVAVTRLIKHKGIHYLIESFNRLKDEKRIPEDFKLVIVGDGFHTDDYVDFLKNELSIGRDSVVFTGNQGGETLAQLFFHAYLFVQPSESEGLSISLLEAMKYGVAPLVSDIQENLEAIGNAGFTFEAKNVDDLTSVLHGLIHNPDVVASVAGKARIRADKEFDWAIISAKTANLYQDVLNRSNIRKLFYARK